MRKKYFSGDGLVSGILLPLGLICLFAFCSLALALNGGTAYRNIQQNIDEDYSGMVAANYLRTKLAQNNEAGRITLREMDGIPVLVIQTDHQEIQYETRIYVYDGVLRESFTAAERMFTPSTGAVIAPVEKCDFSIVEGLFVADITTLGQATRTAFVLAQGGTL